MLRVLAFGDSVAAGVGCPEHGQAFVGGIGRALVAELGRPVAWSVLAESGLTAAEMHQRLLPRLEKGRYGQGVAEAIGHPPSLGDRPDLVVVSVGVNHVLSLHSAAVYREELTGLLSKLKAVVGDSCQVIVGGMPPLAEFPQLSQLWPLSRLVGAYAGWLDRVTRQVCAECQVDYLEWDFSALLGEDLALFMAPDGFHPGPRACEQIGIQVARAYARQQAVALSRS